MFLYDQRERWCVMKRGTSEMETPSGALLGTLFRCTKGHEWESAVGGVWLQMPTCPVCKPEMEVPAVAWMGRWEKMSNACGEAQTKAGENDR